MRLADFATDATLVPRKIARALHTTIEEENDCRLQQGRSAARTPFAIRRDPALTLEWQIRAPFRSFNRPNQRT